MKAEDASKVDERYPFRTDFANANLPWYQVKNLEFPPHHSDRRIGGELVSVDYIHRRGQFRATKTGELIDFTIPAYGTANYLNAEAPLRDLPLGTQFLFFLNQDAQGAFSLLATMQDQFTMDASHGFTYRLDEARVAEGKLLTTKHSIAKNQPDLGKKELLVSPATRVWKGGKAIALSELQPGDELLYNLTGKTATSPGHCSDLWVGVDSHKLATETQHKAFADFTKLRGVPGWIDKTEGNKITLTFFGDSRTFQSTWMGDFQKDKDCSIVVANDELRTWNPPVDKERIKILEIQDVPANGYGCSGVRIVGQVSYMLEGFRQGRVVRIFGAGWAIKDQPYGESLMGYGYGNLKTEEAMEWTPKEYPEQYPYRTDYGNVHLPWFKVKAGETPAPASEHRVMGELLEVNVEKQSGRFRMEKTGKEVAFTLNGGGTVRCLNANATLADLPIGSRCRFHLYQDASGAFTIAQVVADEFSYLAGNALTYRIESAKVDEGYLLVARQLPEVKNYNGDMERPPDIGRSILRVAPETRVWKGDQPVKLSDLAVGDALLVNVSSEQSGRPSRATDIWIGEDTHKLMTERQSKKLASAKK